MWGKSRPMGAGYTVPYGDVRALEAGLRRVLTRPEEAAGEVKTGQSFINQHLNSRAIIYRVEEVIATISSGHLIRDRGNG